MQPDKKIHSGSYGMGRPLGRSSDGHGHQAGGDLQINKAGCHASTSPESETDSAYHGASRPARHIREKRASRDHRYTERDSPNSYDWRQGWIAIHFGKEVPRNLADAIVWFRSGKRRVPHNDFEGSG